MKSNRENDIEKVSVNEFFKELLDKPIDEVVSGLIHFTEFINKNKKNGEALFKKLLQLINDFTAPYLMKPLISGQMATIVPANHSIIILLSSFIGNSHNVVSFTENVDRFILNCNKFTEPKNEALSEDEMNLVMKVAQEKFRIMDIINKNKKLLILQYNYSYQNFNSQCGFADDTIVINVYCPNDVSVHDSVFIFAHELGHALHYALTDDINVVPAKFHEFNEVLKIGKLPIEQAREVFADMVGISIVKDSLLSRHMPSNIKDYLGELFVNYVTSVTNNYKGV